MTVETVRNYKLNMLKGPRNDFFNFQILLNQLQQKVMNMFCTVWPLFVVFNHYKSLLKSGTGLHKCAPLEVFTPL